MCPEAGSRERFGPVTTTGTSGSATSYPPLPGPVDREDFADAQRRHRRVRRWYTATSTLAMLAMGVPLAVVITPLLLLVAVLATDLLNLVVAVALFLGLIYVLPPTAALHHLLR